ncbi:uncharacterized protein LOC120549649 isoform X2 [Perca fluviatilis]|uniref:uncharacterized protein LOC120549649 isoform X2 n=1 Tax=Perca fluviatilis TaxID=8168 RepID=UPI00196399FC|nr:uncharacterized protein LOC120549649 isoform X2 [Perca fluviatilis]
MLSIKKCYRGTSTTTTWPTTPVPSLNNSKTTAAEEKLLQLVATPDYPVAAGQKVDLHCSAFTTTVSVKWSWQHLKNQTWQDVGTDRNMMTLTKPEQSGLYRCRSESNFSLESVSSNHTVYIVSVNATVGEYLGIAAFVLSLLALSINFAILFWLGWQRFGATLTINTAAKGFPGPEKSPKGGLPQTESDGDVYMNYTSQAYCDLDPTTVSVDNVYSSLS